MPSCPSAPQLSVSAPLGSLSSATSAARSELEDPHLSACTNDSRSNSSDSDNVKDPKKVNELLSMADAIRVAANDASKVADLTAAALNMGQIKAENGGGDDDDIFDKQVHVKLKKQKMDTGPTGGPRQEQAMMQLLARGVEGRAARNGEGGAGSFDTRVDRLSDAISATGQVANLISFLNGGIAEGWGGEAGARSSITDSLEAGAALAEGLEDVNAVFGNMNSGDSGGESGGSSTHLQPSAVVCNANGPVVVIVYPKSGVNGDKRVDSIIPIPVITDASMSTSVSSRTVATHEDTGSDYDVASISMDLLDNTLQDQKEKDRHDAAMRSTKEENETVNAHVNKYVSSTRSTHCMIRRIICFIGYALAAISLCYLSVFIVGRNNAEIDSGTDCKTVVIGDRVIPVNRQGETNWQMMHTVQHVALQFCTSFHQINNQTEDEMYQKPAFGFDRNAYGSWPGYGRHNFQRTGTYLMNYNSDSLAPPLFSNPHDHYKDKNNSSIDGIIRGMLPIVAGGGETQIYCQMVEQRCGIGQFCAVSEFSSYSRAMSTINNVNAKGEDKHCGTIAGATPNNTIQRVRCLLPVVPPWAALVMSLAIGSSVGSLGRGAGTSNVAMKSLMPAERRLQNAEASSWADGAAFSLKKIIETSNGNTTIDLKFQIEVATSDPQITITSGRHITINGNGAVLDGGRRAGFLKLQPSARVTLYSITLQNFVAGDACIVADRATVNIHNSVFRSNSQKYIGQGSGAVDASSSTVTIYNSKFEGYNGWYTIFIRDFHNMGVMVSIYNCTAAPIPSQRPGQALFVHPSVQASKVSIYNSNFHATGFTFLFSSLTVTIHSSIFQGASILTRGPKFNVHSSVFQDSSAVNARGGQVNIHDSIFQDNIIDGRRGGAIYAIDGSRIHVHDSIFRRNRGSSGGAIYASGQTATVDIRNSIFQNNSATGKGGAIFIGPMCCGQYHYTVNNLYNVTLQNNTAGDKGGAIYASSSTTNVHGRTIFRNNTALNGGPHIFNDHASVFFQGPWCDTNGTFRESISGIEMVSPTELPVYDVSGRGPDCKLCSVGKFSKWGKACRLCFPTSIAAVEGTARCAACPHGQYATPDRTVCNSCGLGRYRPAGSISCDACPSGKFANFTGSLTCSSCSPGKYANDTERKVACYASCPSGKYNNSDNTACPSCTAGSYSEGPGNSECIECNPGWYGPGVARQTKCEACPPGKYSIISASAFCFTCDQGHYRQEAGQTSCFACADLEGFNCSQGQFHTCGRATSFASSGTCLRCPPGRFRSQSNRACELCQNDTYSEGGSANCKRCPAGKYGVQGHEFCESMAKCDPGKFVKDIDLKGESRCESCPSQYYSNTSDAVICDACENGRYQNREGSFYCEQLKTNQLLMPKVLEDGTVTAMEPWDCPETGMTCTVDTRSYDGGVWHHPSNKFPTQQDLYTCVNDGCPPKGATNMSCQEGYKANSPLCAVCSEGYFSQLRSCVLCKSLRIWQLAVVASVLILVIGLLTLAHHKCADRLDTLLPYVKVMVSFVTIVATLETQFGVRWPTSFLSALAVLSALSFDLSMLSGLFCIVRVSYFDNLMFSTIGLVVIVVLAVVVACAKPRLRTASTQVAIYILLFAYPVTSVKIIAAFGCHEVNGVYYLREDYDVQCYTSEWTVIAVYASVFLAVYVIAMPIVVLVTLSRYGQRYRRGDIRIWDPKVPKESISIGAEDDGDMELQKGMQIQARCSHSDEYAPGTIVRHNKDDTYEIAFDDGLMLGFLLDDYALVMPAMLWDGIEMIRKLLLSIIGALWPNQSPLAIATALVLSVFFLAIHLSFRPFKRDMVNRVQTCALIADCFLYLGGLLIKGGMAGGNGKWGASLVFMLIMPVVTSFGAIVLDVHAQRTKEKKKAKQHASFDRAVNTAIRTEPLTGLLNKKAFDDDIAAIVSDERVCIMNIDLTALGFCNDALGHEGANEVIRYFAGGIKAEVDKWHPAHAITDSKSTAYRQGGDEYAVICYPKTRAALGNLVRKLARISWTGKGTEPKHKGVKCHSWLRLGVVWKVGATVAEADRLEAQVKANLNAAGAKLAKGVPAPSLQGVLSLPSKPFNFLIDAAPKGIWQRAVSHINTFQRRGKTPAQPDSQSPLELFAATHVNDAERAGISAVNPMHRQLVPLREHHQGSDDGNAKEEEKSMEKRKKNYLI